MQLAVIVSHRMRSGAQYCNKCKDSRHCDYYKYIYVMSGTWYVMIKYTGRSMTDLVKRGGTGIAYSLNTRTQEPSRGNP